jgi:hypothetical protein
MVADMGRCGGSRKVARMGRRKILTAAGINCQTSYVLPFRFAPPHITCRISHIDLTPLRVQKRGANYRARASETTASKKCYKPVNNQKVQVMGVYVNALIEPFCDIHALDEATSPC